MKALLYIVFETRTRPSGAAPWWIQAAAHAKMEARILYADAMGVLALPSGEMVIIQSGGHILPWPDAVIMRCYNKHISLCYQRMGIPVFNSWSTMELCRDKLLCNSTLGAAGLPVAATVEGTGLPLASVGVHTGSPFITKPLSGSQGHGVALTEAEYGQYLRKDYIAQQYIGTRPGTDIRVWVLQGRALDAVVRSNPGATASNLGAGGHALPLRGKMRPAALALAEKAAAACGLLFAGVDILYGPGHDALTVCEVNGNPGFRSLPVVRGRRLVRAVTAAVAALI